MKGGTRSILMKVIDEDSRISDYLFLKNLDINEKNLKSIYRIISGDPLKKDFDNNKIKKVADWYRVNNDSIDIISFAATFYHVFNVIRPFEKDNMRMAQIFTNVILIKHGYPPIDISLDNKLIFLSMNLNNIEENVGFIESIIKKEIDSKRLNKDKFTFYDEVKKSSEI